MVSLRECFLWLCLVLLNSNLFSQSLDWRFGFEYNELPPPITSEANHDTLLSRLSYIVASQSTSAINVNGNGWLAMQPTENSPIDFSESDGWVKRFGDANFELEFYLTPNTPWSQVGNSTCANGPANDECSPDSAHMQDWIDYVMAVVERYDGDGVDDMPGLTKPVHFYVMPQEVTFSGAGGGSQDDEDGIAFWDDNMQKLINVHRITYQAMYDADPTGHSKLVGSGGWFLDLYSDFPDYPNIEGPTVTARLNGQNLFGSNYQASFDSMKVLLAGLADTTDGKKCDYIGWHPHTGWKATDQSFRFIHTYAPDMPIFIDDMWCAMLTSWNGLFFTLKDGYCQFIGGDSIEGDFPTASIASYQNLFNGLDDGDTAITNWYNAKTAREAVKCFATCFGEGAERVDFSMTNDINPDNFLLYPFSQPYRYTGLTERKDNDFAPKPVMYTMRLLVDKLYDFTSVSDMNSGGNPKTRIYKFGRSRGTSCYVAWSETGWNTETPEIPNGETVTIPVISDTLTLTNIITQPGMTEPTTSEIISSNSTITWQLGFKPVIIEEHDVETGVTTQSASSFFAEVFPNPVHDVATLHYSLPASSPASIDVFDVMGRRVFHSEGNQMRGEYRQIIPLDQKRSGLYYVLISAGKEKRRIVLLKQ